MLFAEILLNFALEDISSGPQLVSSDWFYFSILYTMLYAFYSYPITPAFNRWGIYLNYLVHSYMYSYYFLRSMKIKVPGPVAKFVTTIQIWQFIISVAILIHLGWLTFVENVKFIFVLMKTCIRLLV
ncbi:unnamed protein product [Meloidogyne enterolobii]|uniref:Uncharacterized protein n=1 Tax=Meloidogyne enterolobii TaxID=390850 RepID=A0ACB0ZK64_MELEN